MALTELDQEKLVQVTTDIVHALVESIADDAALEVNVSEDRLQVRVDCADTGLLIGRDGQIELHRCFPPCEMIRMVLY